MKVSGQYGSRDLLKKTIHYNPNAAPGRLPGQAGCHFFRLSAQVYLEKSDIVRFGELVLHLLREFDPSFYA